MAANVQQQLPEIGYVRLPSILRVIPVSKSTWWAWVKSGKAPKGRKLSPRVRAWTVESIRALIAEIGA